MIPDPKVKSWSEAKSLAESLHEKNKTIVFTNGCFDLIHIGHLRYLAEARSLGDFLMVGLNSDRSVTGLKGPSRPIIPQAQRAEVLSGLTLVDAVIVFDQPDPHELITLVQPDVLVKGGDWPVDRIVGRDVVWARGGTVKTIPLIPDVSTSGIVDRILALHGQG